MRQRHKAVEWFVSDGRPAVSPDASLISIVSPEISASRLQTLTNDLTGTAQDLGVGFTYNPAGQIASVTRSNDGYAWPGYVAINRPYVANGLNQLTSAGGTALGYDARGNLNASGSSLYGYNSDNLMTSAPGVAMTYNGLGQLVTYNAASQITRFVYNGAEIGVETDNNGVIQRRYVTGPGDDAPIVWYEGAGITDKRYLMSDERGSIVSVTDGAGATLRINSYDDYGIPAPTNLGRFQYTGQVWLPELGMYYYKARMYSPSLGRFMQTDPIGYGDGMNWYNYVGGDPVNGRDASGLASIDYGPCYGGSGCWDSSANDGAGEIVVSYRPSHYIPQEQPGAGFMDMYNPLNSLGLGGAAAAVFIPNNMGLPALPPPPLPKHPSPEPCPAVPPGGAGQAQLDRNIAEARRMARVFPPRGGPSGSLTTGTWLSNKVQAGGEWDYKQDYEGGQDYGNFNYGATSVAAGFDPSISDIAADLYSIYDHGTLEDQDTMIQLGQQYAEMNCDDR